MKHTIKLTLFSLTAAFCSCTGTADVDKEYMALENVNIYINDMSTSYTQKAAEGKGNSLGKIDSDFKFNHFDIDERNRNLYVLNEDNLPVVFHLDNVSLE